MKLILYAPNIHTGGGAVLANALLKEVDNQKIESLIFIDERYNAPIPPSIQTIRVSPTLKSRLQAEFDLKKIARSSDVVFSFGNLPPIKKLPCKNIVYLHNRNLLPGVSIRDFPLKARIRQHIERMWIKSFINNANYFVVQTQAMKESFNKSFPNIHCAILPFVPEEVLNIQPEKNSAKIFDFLYIASGDAHKNHECLLNAWELLAKQDRFPTLALTLPPNSYKLLNKISILNENSKTNIKNFSALSHAEILKLYSQTKTFIFPSLQESFGIPLIEATNAGLPVLASNLNYVHDVILPTNSFDPYSPVDIAKCVFDHLNTMEPAPSTLNTKVFGPREIIEELLKTKDTLR